MERRHQGADADQGDRPRAQLPHAPRQRLRAREPTGHPFAATLRRSTVAQPTNLRPRHRQLRFLPGEEAVALLEEG